ncbi:hypothetical protein B0J14DRAFT_601479 [Halenospora varia]|nr:hypothetical protein B0J14DRAFT_601479 [Halenospora varia]
MPGIQEFEPEYPQRVKRLWNAQFNARRDAEFGNLASVPVERTSRYSEKEMDQAHLNVFQKAIAVQRAEAGAQKRARIAWEPENTRKKFRGEVNSSVGACIIVGRGEISSMELRNHIDTESNPSHIDQPSMKRSPTVPNQDCSPTPSHTKTSTDSSQIEHSLPLPCESRKGSSSNQGSTFKVPEVLPTLEKPGEARGECQNGVPTSREKVSTNTMKPPPPQSSIVTHLELPLSTCHPSGQPQSNNISGATSAAVKRLPITDLLNSTSPAEPPQPTTLKTTSSGPPFTSTGLGKLQGQMPADFQPHIERSTSSSRKLSKMASHPETSSSLGQASGDSELALVCASDNKLASGPRSDRRPLEGRVVAQKLAMAGKILIPKSDAPDLMVMLSIDPLLFQNAPDFFRFYSQTAGAGEVSMLCFGLLDVTWQRHQIWNISRGDFDAFGALKRTIWDCFCIFLTRGLGPAVFRVVIAEPVRRVAGDAVTTSRPTASKTEYSGASAPLARPIHHDLASNAELVHFLPSSQVPVSSAQTSSSQKAVRGFQPTPQGRDAGAWTQRKHSTTEFPAAPAGNTTRKTLRDRLPPLQIAPTPQYHHPLAIPPAMTYRQKKPVSETSSAIQIAVRIQENEHSRFSRPYNKNVLLSEVTTVDFFAWFAHRTGYACPCGPPELMFTWKGALPEPKYARIKRGDEEHFQYMKGDVKPHFEQTKALMPELIEFVILVIVPGWAAERPGVVRTT